jgi:hypothetical protein
MISRICAESLGAALSHARAGKRRQAPLGARAGLARCARAESAPHRAAVLSRRCQRGGTERRSTPAASTSLSPLRTHVVAVSGVREPAPATETPRTSCAAASRERRRRRARKRATRRGQPQAEDTRPDLHLSRRRLVCALPPTVDSF